MSIDAVVKEVVRYVDGSGYLLLVDRIKSGKGESYRLNFEKSPDTIKHLHEKQIWGGASSIMLGDEEIATRKGYSRIVFDKDFTVIMTEYIRCSKMS